MAPITSMQGFLRHIFVVLGMHRSGTSVITRALAVLGVPLGQNLLGPVEGENPKGFWEDVDVLRLCDALFTDLGTDWRCDLPLGKAAIARVPEAFYALGTEILTAKFGAGSLWGVKNPRINLQLPIWQLLFQRTGTVDHYVFAVRHPAAIIQSLQRRNGMLTAQAISLWRANTLQSLTALPINRAVFVSFEKMLDNPRTQLARLAEALGLPATLTHGPAVDDFVDNFLERSLDHHEVRNSPDLGSEAEELYALLRELADDGASLDAPSVSKRLGRLTKEWRVGRKTLAPPKTPAHDAIWENVKLEALLATRELAITELRQHTIIERQTNDDEIAQLKAMMGEQHIHLDAAQKEITGLNQQLRDNIAATAEEDARKSEAIARLMRVVEDQQISLAAAAEEEARKHDAITGLTRLAEEQHIHLDAAQKEIAGLNQQLRDNTAATAEEDARKSEAIARLMRVVEDQRDALSAVEQEGARRETEIARQATAMAAAGEALDAAAARKKQLDEEVSSLRASLQESRHSAAETSLALNSLEAAHGAQAETLARAKQQLTEMGLALDDLRADWERERRIAAALRADLELLERLLGQIDGAFGELLASSRWRMGNRLGEYKRILTRRPPTSLASDFIVDRLRTFRQWGAMSRNDAAGPASELVLGGLAPGALRPAKDDALPTSVGLPEALALAPPVTVVIPVFNAAEVLELCLASVARNTTGAELLIIDDASTDPRIAPLLDGYARRPGVRVLRNERNLGFTGTVNRAMAETMGDVILLNSDTVVPPRWLQNLRLAAYGRAGVGTVTAVSDNAGAFSVPEPGQRTALPTGIDDDGLGRAVMQASGRVWAELPTGNGFCLYVRRAVIKRVGGFDAQRFPRGYGEENDFCMRALKVGFRHVVDETTFVQHREGQSFGAERQKRLQEGLDTLGTLYPEYGALVAGAFNAPARRLVWRRAGEAVEAAVRPGAGRIRVLAILHQAVGGMPKTALEIASGLDRWFDTLILTSDGLNLRLFSVTSGQLQQIETVRLATPVNDWRQANGEYATLLGRLLVEYAIELVHVHHLASHTLDVFSSARLLDVPVVVTLHDFFMLCPTVHLLDEHGRFCGGTCTATLGDCRSPFSFLASIPGLKHGWLGDWRQAGGQLLAQAAAVVVNHEWVRRLHQDMLSPNLAWATVPLASNLAQLGGVAAAPEPGQPLRILCPGNVDIHKGAQFIHDLATLAGDRVEFHFAGRAAPLLDSCGKHWGTYRGFDGLAAIARDVRPHFIAIFSIWSESWCHVMTEAWALGVPVLVFDIGVQAERLREHGGGWIIPAEPRPALAAIRAAAADVEGWRWQATLASLAGTPGLSDMVAGYDEVYRQALRSRLAFIPEADRPMLRVAVLPQYVGVAPIASAFLRLLGPLAHPLLRPGLALRVLTPEDLPTALDRADMLVIQRVALPPEMVEAVIAACRAKGVKLVLETDDDLFAIGSDHPEYNYYAPRLVSLRRLAEEADTLVASTEMVAAALAPLGRPVTIIPNTLDEDLWLRGHSPALSAGRRAGVIGYVGTPTHGTDLDILRRSMAILAERGVEASVEVVGGEPEGKGQDWFRRILVPAGDDPYPRFVPWLRAMTAHWDIGVAPLQPSAFNAAKSPLKYLEYSAMGLAGVYADLPAYGAHVQHGETGLLAGAEPVAWADALERLIGDRVLRDRVATQALGDVRAKHLHAHAAHRWQSLFSSLREG